MIVLKRESKIYQKSTKNWTKSSTNYRNIKAKLKCPLDRCFSIATIGGILLKLLQKWGKMKSEVVEKIDEKNRTTLQIAK